jgi:hypothetical protein
MRFLILLPLAAAVFGQAIPKMTARSVTAIELPATAARTGLFAPDATVVGGINVKALRESEAGIRAAREWAGAANTAGWDLFGPLIKDLDEVWVSFDPIKNDRTVVMLLGRFRNPLWAQILQTQSDLQTANAIIVGSAAPVADARRRLRTPGAAHPLAAYATELAARGDLWIAGLPAELPSPHEAAREVERFGFTLSLRDRLNLDLTMQAQSAEAAERLMRLFEAAKTQLDDPASGGEDAALIARNLTAAAYGAELRFRLSLDPKDVSAIAEKRMAAVPTFPPARRSVRIYGMDDGPREIPYNGARK